MYKFLIAVSVLFIGCVGGKNDENSKNSKSEKEKKISRRDLSINSSNAYSDIFLDSMQLMKYLNDNKVSDSLKRRMISFYNSRNYQFAWFNSKGLTEQARGFWNLHQYSTTYGIDTSIQDQSLQKLMDDWIAEETLSVSSNNKAYVNAELKLTGHFISYLLNNYEEGFIKRKEMERFIPSKKQDAVVFADSLLNKKHKDEKYYEDVNPAYKVLKNELSLYVAIAKQGGWPLVPASVTQLKPGIPSSDIKILKRRLSLSKDLVVPDTMAIYDQNLINAVNNFQIRHGYSPSSVLTDAQLIDLNVSAVERVKQILLNMGRMQWAIHQSVGQLIVVNIPEFILHVKEGDKKVFDMNVVVGKEGHNTMMFTGNLNQVVFSPYWNVPSSIVTKEILPSIRKNPNYLASHNMQMVKNGSGVPAVRQLPCEKNALGKVKFLFPNSFNIYFHDTPVKSLFAKDKRAYSHGCIRLSDPQKMAEYLLTGTEWSSSKIVEAMNSGKEQFVKLKKPVPVLITYYTAWVDEKGLLHFAEDVYDHDKDVSSRMFI